MELTDITGVRLLNAILKYKLDVSKFENITELRKHLAKLSKNRHYNKHKEETRKKILYMILEQNTNSTPVKSS